jgi:hypothetical protein
MLGIVFPPVNKPVSSYSVSRARDELYHRRDNIQRLGIPGIVTTMRHSAAVLASVVDLRRPLAAVAR